MPAVTDGKRNAASYTGSGDADNLQTVNFTGPALIKVVMRGMAQIMLQENAVTGFSCFPHWDTLKIFFNNFK